MTAAEILTQAAALVEMSWTQDVDALNYLTGPWCAGLALNRAGTRVDCVGLTDAWEAMRREVSVEVPVDVVQWNDEPGRTAIEVATAFRNAKRWLTDAP